MGPLAPPTTSLATLHSSTEVEMKDLGLLHYFLSLEVWQKPGEMFLPQEQICS
jgi:hypothetical protein